ncbi:MAG: metallophosphoesterase [Turneriella sp.]|nr:metallophosphoesterase [Leptospiraceae bacterium]MCX7631727.1 metallophosphoesterase [Turneriella sp.]
MRVVYLTDVHDNFAGVSAVLNHTEGDLYIISGDLTYHAFGSDDEALFRFIELQEKIRNLAADPDNPLATLQYANAAKNGAPVKIRAEEGEEYLRLAARAKEELLRKYQTLAKAIIPTGKRVFMIPGNYDLPLAETAVAPFSLHENVREVDGIRFAGYGSAPVFTPGIPEEIAARFEEHRSGNVWQSRPRDFFLAHDADVYVLHNPAYGTLDKLPRYGHCGSPGIRQAVEQKSPRLVLSGHIHECYGLLKIDQTFFLNPSNFGSVETLDGEQVGGFFATILLQQSDERVVYVREVLWQRFLNGKFYTIAAIKIDKNYRASEQVLDAKLFAEFGPFLR